MSVRIFIHIYMCVYLYIYIYTHMPEHMTYTRCAQDVHIYKISHVLRHVCVYIYV